MNNKKRGQITVYGVVMIFLSIVVFASIYPSLDAQITVLVAALGEGTAAATIVQLIPLFLGIGILASLFFYISPARDYPTQQDGRF